MTNWTEINGRSVLFGACVLLGLVISRLEGASYLDLARTALLASVLFLCFLLGEAALNRYRHALIRLRRRR
jgi:hypothetical protein